MNQYVRVLLLLTALTIRAGAEAAPPSTSEPTRLAPPQPEAETRLLAASNSVAVTAAPLYLKVLSVTVFAKQAISAAGADTVIYQTAGTTAVTVGGQRKTLNVGEAFALKSGQKAELAAGAGVSAFVTFNLVSAEDLGRTLLTAPSIVTELFRTPAAIPGLNPGRYELTLSEMTLPANMSDAAPYHHAGAVLYYTVSGSGFAIAGEKTGLSAGEFVYTPDGLVRQWGTVSDLPLRLVVFSLNPAAPATKP